MATGSGRAATGEYSNWYGYGYGAALGAGRAPVKVTLPDYSSRHGYGHGAALRKRRLVESLNAAVRLSSPDRHALRLAEAQIPAPRQIPGVALLRIATNPVHGWIDRADSFFDSRLVEKSCLANAIYFEARSESMTGQLAVASVILNRVKTAQYPSTICAVVYQGASRRNACQFSFACDGKPDVPRPGHAWQAAVAAAAMALDGTCFVEDEDLKTIITATHYHADYVDPYWSKVFNRLTKIGRHIFYSQG